MNSTDQESNSTTTGTSRWGHRGALFAGAVLGAGLLVIGPLGAMSAQAAVPVLLGTAGAYAVLGATPNVTNTGPSTINGSVGISPGASLVGFSGPPQATVTGGVLEVATPPPPQAQLDLTTAYDQARSCRRPRSRRSSAAPHRCPGRTPTHRACGGLDLTGTITLDGGGSYDSVWVFQSSSALITAGTVSLINGAQACNVYWQVTQLGDARARNVLRGHDPRAHLDHGRQRHHGQRTAPRPQRHRHSHQ